MVLGIDEINVEKVVTSLLYVSFCHQQKTSHTRSLKALPATLLAALTPAVLYGILRLRE